MPPIVYDPANNGNTSGGTYIFVNTNAHGSHKAVSINGWKVTVTTDPLNGGTVIADTGPLAPPIASYNVGGLPADNGWYYAQVVYQKTDGQWYSGASNYFQSRA